MAFKTLIFFGLLAMALGFTLPEEQFDDSYVEPEWVNGEQYPIEDQLVLIRRARSPQGRFSANVGHHSRFGTSAGVDYTRPLNKNWEVYAGAQRNFRFNENSGHAGLRYNF